MQEGIRSRMRALLTVGAALLALTAVALPSTASATTATSGTGEHIQRESFMRYLYGLGFGGTITALSPATFSTNTASYADDVVAYSFDGANTTYDVTARAGRGTIAFTGGVRYQMAAHYIDVSISDPRVVVSSPTQTNAVVSAVVSYDPLETGTQVANPTTPTRIDLFRLDLSGVFGGLGGTTHTWTRAPAVLTADGANAFNGGTNGSYSDGSAFGYWNLSAGY